MESPERGAILGDGAAAVFKTFDTDGDGKLDAKELQKLIALCLKTLTPPEDSEELKDLMGDFELGSREYCCTALQLICADGRVTESQFVEWMSREDNFLFFPLRKFKVMLWAMDLFQEFDMNGDGWVTEEEFQSAMARITAQLESGLPDSSAEILSALTFREFDANQDALISSKELVDVLLGMWERLYNALFREAEDFFAELDSD